MREKERAGGGPPLDYYSRPRPHFKTYSERHLDVHGVVRDSLYRSNSSLELMGCEVDCAPPVLRREYGSHGSIDVISSPDSRDGGGGSFFDMLQDMRPTVGADQRSPGPQQLLSTTTTSDDRGSPKAGRRKFAKFWAKTPGSGVAVGRSEMEGANGNIDGEGARRRVFAHYDVQSLSANLSYAARLRGLLAARRRNTATGASAASLPRAATPDSPEQDEDPGDTNNNQLIQSCPFFRNEVGGEQERMVWLGRTQQTPSCKSSSTSQGPVHRPVLACGMSVLEYTQGETHWTITTCPYSQQPRPLEQIDRGAHYYRDYFHGSDHQNWFGMDDNLGPVAISLKRERIEQANDSTNTTGQSLYRYRVIIRTSELLTLRGSILEDAIPNIKPTNSTKAISTKEVLEYVAPELLLSCLRLGLSGTETEDALMKLDEQGLSRHYKVGIMYCQAGQSTEEHMYNNQDASPIFTEFLDTIGQTVRLKGFDKYRAGLDNKTDSTGLYSVYAQHQDCEVMFHVSTLLPFTPNNRQQLLRKRHIGNDIVTIVFQEPGALPFTPKVIRSQFQHVFIVVRAINPCTDNAHYSVAVSRSKEVPVFGPPIPDGGTFPKGKAFTDFLLAKVINAENAAHRSEKFATMATRTRQEYLKDLVTNYTSNIIVETSQKFSMLSFSKKKERWRGRVLPDSSVRGAVSWQVLLDDSTQSLLIECFLAISSDSLVLVEESTREIVFATPTKSILGWSTNTNSLRLYYHQGECITFHMKEAGERDELMEVVVRLRTVTNGSVAQELSLKRNPLGQLGFHVQPDGVVTQVEHKGLAWLAGLRQAARLVEICKVAVSTLSHDQMIDLLKTSVAVTVTVIPPNTDASVRKGCSEQACRYNSHFEGDYENVNNQDSRLSKTARQQPVSKSNRYERSFSPPRSSNSSGYGTGSSSKSFSGEKISNSENGSYSVLETNHQDFKVGEIVTTCLMKAERSHEVRRNIHEYIHTSNGLDYTNGLDYPSDTKSAGSLSETGRHTTASDTDTSSTSTDRLLPFPSEEDLSGGSSPGGLRRSKTTGCLAMRNDSPMGSTGSPRSSALLRDSPRGSTVLLRDSSPRSSGVLLRDSSPRSSGVIVRDSSPRSQTESSPRSSAVILRDNGEARRRPQSSYNRNSASLSTLQQDLIRLINPDSEPDNSSHNLINMDSKETRESGRRAKSKESLLICPQTISREKSLVIDSTAPALQGSQLNKDKPTQEVIVTMARPATVISTSSNSYSSSVHDSPGRMVKRKVLPWPEPSQEMDWPSLVDTATKAMMTLEPNENTHETVIASLHHNTHEREHELNKQISQLEGKLSRETMRRLSLEEEVRSLREENRRLQQESQSAAQQLRRFTEWFFQTIDKQ